MLLTRPWPISQTSTQYMDFVEIFINFNISQDLTTIYFANFGGCCVSFVYSCQSIVKWYNLFSGVKLSTRSFCFISVLRLRPKHYLGCRFVYIGPVNC